MKFFLKFIILLLTLTLSLFMEQTETCDSSSQKSSEKICPSTLSSHFTPTCNPTTCTGCSNLLQCKSFGCSFSEGKCSGNPTDPFHGACSDRYILHYFPGNGRAVMIRALLSYVQATWKNDQVAPKDWPKLKKSGLCEFEQMPVLEINGEKKLAQSMAILYYLGRKFDLMGKNMEENYEIDSLLGCFTDIADPIWKFMFNPNEKEKKELRETALEKFKFYLGKIEERYLRLGKGKYFLGERFTLADLFVGAAIPSFRDSFGEVIVPTSAPSLAGLIKRLKNNELKEFHEKYFVSSQK